MATRLIKMLMELIIINCLMIANKNDKIKFKYKTKMPSGNFPQLQSHLTLLR